MQPDHWTTFQHPQQSAAAACRKARLRSWDRRTGATPCTTTSCASSRPRSTRWSAGSMFRWRREDPHTIHRAYSSTCRGTMAARLQRLHRLSHKLSYSTGCANKKQSLWKNSLSQLLQQIFFTKLTAFTEEDSGHIWSKFRYNMV